MITSMQNPKVRQALALAHGNTARDTHFLVEGAHQVAEARLAGVLEFALSADPSLDGLLVSTAIIKRLAHTTTPQPIIGVVRKLPVQPLGTKVLILDGVQDPGNLGTLIRAARAFGFTDCAVIGASVYNPKVVRSAQGAYYGFNVFNTRAISDLNLSAHCVYVSSLAPSAQDFVTVNYEAPLALVLGSEGSGVSAAALELATTLVKIPIRFESLNVAMAGGILLYHIAKQLA